MLKNVKTYLKTILTLTLLFSSMLVISCGGGGGSGGGDGVTPDYTNLDLPLTETQDWLIMYYCDADNDLEEFIMNDLNEMESIDLTSAKIKIVALVDRNGNYDSTGSVWDDSRVYEITHDVNGYNHTIVSKRIAIETLGISNNASSAEVNMGSGDTLTKFIEFCNDNYPATHKMLLFTNHGGGWRENPAAKKSRLEKIGVTKAVCWDETDGDDCLYTSEIRTAVTNAMGATRLDVIAYDACLMAMVEVAFEMKDIADYMIASEETIPGFGFPYTQILDALPSDLNAYTPVQFGQNIINEYYAAYTSGGSVEETDFTDNTATLSLIQLNQITALTTAINSFGSALNTANGSNANMNMRIISETFANSDYVDIKNYCSNETLCTTERTAVTTAFNAAVIYNRSGSGNSGANGLSIFMPLRWTAWGEQVDYTSTNLQFVNTGAAPAWRTYLTSLTATTATDQNEIEESANGGGIIASIGTTETGYIYYAGDDDIYIINSSSGSDGSFRMTVGGTATGYVDYWVVSSATGMPVSYDYAYTGDTVTISFNPSTQYVFIEAYNYDEGYPLVSTTNYYTLAFTNN